MGGETLLLFSSRDIASYLLLLSNIVISVTILAYDIIITIDQYVH